MTHRFVFTDELHASSLLCASSPANLPRSFDHQLAVIAYGATGTGKTHIRDSKEERVGKFTFIDLAGSEGFNDAKTDQQQKASVLDMHERQRELCNDDDD